MRNKLVVLTSSLLICLVLLQAVPFSIGAQASNLAAPTSVVPTPTAKGTPTIPAPKTATPNPTFTSVARPTDTPEEKATPVPGDRNFPETGFTVPGVFIRYWDSHGGLPIFGYPLSEARSEVNLADGKTYLVQYFERNRFEFHPEFKDTPNEVLLGLLGVELTRGRVFPPSDPFADTLTSIYLEPTKHSLSEPFLSYWRKYGGLGIFGYPISEPFNEKSSNDGKTYQVQYFQRNRFEYHPENVAPYDVLLGLLGKDYMDMQASVLAWGPPIAGGVRQTAPIWKAAKPEAGGRFLRGPVVGDGMIVQGYYQDRERILNAVNDLQFGWIKQQIEWKETENPKGAYYFEEADKIVNAAQAHNVRVLLSVVKAPTWASGGFNGLPKNPDDLRDFMAALAAHFKGRVAAYEIWNEQNLFGETGDVNPARFVEVLKAGYIGVKSADPSAIVLCGALSPTGVNDPLGKRAPGAMGAIPDPIFLEQMYQYQDGEVRGYFDALAAHPYGFNNPPDTGWPDNPNVNPLFPLASDGKPDFYNRHNSFYFRRIEELRSVMEKYGDGEKQMWLTEYGWCSDYRADGYAECRYNTLEQQGAYTVQAIARAKKYYPWMGVMFLWNLNFATFQEWFTGPSHFSIVSGDWSARPAYVALRNRPK